MAKHHRIGLVAMVAAVFVLVLHNTFLPFAVILFVIGVVFSLLPDAEEERRIQNAGPKY